MPQTIVEYSNNLVEKNILDPKILPIEINKVLAAFGQFGEADLKCVVRGSDIYARSVEPQGKAFLWIDINILEGRPLEFRKQISTNIIAMLKQHVKSIDGLEVQISCGVHEMTKDSYIKEVLA